MRIERRNGNTTVIGIIVAVVVLIGIVFWMSDVWRTKAQTAYNDWTSWTAEQIAKDPENYLNFAEKQVKETQTKLTSSEIRIKQKKSELDKMKQGADKKIEFGQKALNEFRDLYKAAAPSNQFPISWRESEYDKKKAGIQLQKLDRDLKSQEKFSKTVATGLKKLEQQIQILDQKKMECQEQLAKIKSNREILRVNKITEDFTDELVKMNTTISATVDAVAEVSDSDVKSLDDLVNEEAGSADTSEIDRILNEG